MCELCWMCWLSAQMCYLKKNSFFLVPEMWSYENMFVFYQSFNIFGYFTRVISVSDLKRVGLVSKTKDDVTH